QVGMEGFISRVPGSRGPCPQGCPIGHLVEPAPQEPALADGIGLVQEGQKCSLKGVLDVLFATQDAPAYVPHHGPMAPDQHFKRGRIALLPPSVQELGIIGAAAVWVSDPMQVSQDRAELSLAHGGGPPGKPAGYRVRGHWPLIVFLFLPNLRRMGICCEGNGRAIRQTCSSRASCSRPRASPGAKPPRFACRIIPRKV